jgi:hypothetical protein
MKLGLIKFKYGEEIICEYEKSPSSVQIKNAAFMMPIENNQWHLMTWLPYTNVKDGVSVELNEVLFIADLSADMIQYYKNWREALQKNVRLDLDK